jgi:hypothetical protein
LGTVKTLDQGHGDDEEMEAEFWAYLGDGEIQEADDLDAVRNEMKRYYLSFCYCIQFVVIVIASHKMLVLVLLVFVFTTKLIIFIICNSMWKRLLPSCSSFATIPKQDPF